MRTIRPIVPAEMDGIYTRAMAGPDIGHHYLRRIGDMRQLFFFMLLLALPTAILAALLYSAGRYLYSLYEDKKELKQLDAIAAESAARREQRRRENANRLENGCQHTFDAGIGFPPGVCPKCGLARERPPGDCDHVWRRVESPMPASSCVLCGKTYRTEL